MYAAAGDILLIEEELKIVVIGEPSTGKVSNSTLIRIKKK